MAGTRHVRAKVFRFMATGDSALTRQRAGIVIGPQLPNSLMSIGLAMPSQSPAAGSVVTLGGFAQPDSVNRTEGYADASKSTAAAALPCDTVSDTGSARADAVLLLPLRQHDDV